MSKALLHRLLFAMSGSLDFPGVTESSNRLTTADNIL